MGKKSKSSNKKGSDRPKSNDILHKPKENEIPLYRHQRPSFFKTLVDEINPVQRFDAGETWICYDDDSFVAPTRNEMGEMVAERQKIRQHGAPAECPLCFADAFEQCSKCTSVFYCGAECQKKHWKQCHKKACKPNPHKYRFDVNIDQFRSLPGEAFEGHEFIVIKPTEKLSSLDDICNVCLESADDIFEKIPGFGNDQIQPLWTMNNTNHPISNAIRKHFGWTSPCHAIDTLEGYRNSEDHFVYMLMYDDNFLNERNMAASYYGDACFPHARNGKHVRGNLVIFKLYIQNKRRKAKYLSNVLIALACTDDDDLEYEYILHPINKAEIAHMLQERRKAIEQGKYTRRQWRCVIRREERAIETASMGGKTLSFGW